MIDNFVLFLVYFECDIVMNIKYIYTLQHFLLQYSIFMYCLCAVWLGLYGSSDLTPTQLVWHSDEAVFLSIF